MIKELYLTKLQKRYRGFVLFKKVSRFSSQKLNIGIAFNLGVLCVFLSEKLLELEDLL